MTAAVRDPCIARQQRCCLALPFAIHGTRCTPAVGFRRCLGSPPHLVAETLELETREKSPMAHVPTADKIGPFLVSEAGIEPELPG